MSHDPVDEVGTGQVQQILGDLGGVVAKQEFCVSAKHLFDVNCHQCVLLKRL